MTWRRAPCHVAILYTFQTFQASVHIEQRGAWREICSGNSSRISNVFCFNADELKKNVKERHLWDYSGELRLSVGERTASEPLQHTKQT